MAVRALLYRGNVIGLLVDRADGNVIGAATVARFAIVDDIQVREVGCRGERGRYARDGYAMTDTAILTVRPTQSDWNWQMGYRFPEERVSRCGEVTVMALPTISCVDACVVEAHPGKINGVVTVGAVLVGERRREVVGQLAHADHVVVASGAGQCRHVNRTVREGAGGEGPGGVADAAILGRRQMHTVGIEILTTGGNAVVAGGAIVNESGMVYQSALAEECRLEKFGSMTVSAIGRGIQMSAHRGCLAGCESVEIGIADVVVAGIAGLHHGIDTVVENTIQAEARNTVAGFTVDIHHRVALGFSGRVDSMAGVAAVADHLRAVMVGVGIGKISCVMAQFAFPG